MSSRCTSRDNKLSKPKRSPKQRRQRHEIRSNVIPKHNLTKRDKRSEIKRDTINVEDAAGRRRRDGGNEDMGNGRRGLNGERRRDGRGEERRESIGAHIQRRLEMMTTNFRQPELRKRPPRDEVIPLWRSENEDEDVEL
jgi:hypothetical protein